MHSGKQTKTTQTCPNRVSSFVRNLSVYKLQKLLFVFLYINLNSPQKSRFYLIIIINYRGVGWLRDDVTWRQLRVQMRTLSSFKKICENYDFKPYNQFSYHHILPKNVRKIYTSQSDNDMKFPMGFS